ncbi:P-loop containing nucleoside triphosphate hydrolase protein [Fomitopsis serialis]|uniref:P-loop containing nucleoside triphosphate hydrolase protein n=1 Tax=Fomitopsis serialis TaxID=139415 RepID=UPI0020088C80|nr:P-loop containing nucleoside triphosphate hydrolase protein [Neoantrodia serialis]KAH9912363.1 P-loop containing nucleoside triphosphate hydrolase protein [Neoantrodia serialis]
MARLRKRSFSQRWARRRDAAGGFKWQQLSEDDVSKLHDLIHKTYGWPARNFQLEGIRAQLEGVDMMIQAPTGSGKTAVVAGAHLWPQDRAKVTIMVSPLLSLEDEMVKTFKEQFGLDAIAVSSKNGSCSPLVVKRILALKYQVILASPEMLQSRTFVKKILRNSKFTRHVLSLVIDEAHCVSHWGADFRKKYASLGVIRAFLPRGTPVIALTATLTGRVRRDIHSKLHFPKGGSRFVNIGNDRPNIALVVRANQHALNSFEDLDFVIPQSASCPQDIPKTWIYVDNINTGAEIIDFLADRLERRTAHRPEGPLSADLIRPFNATLSSEYRTAAMAAFRDGDIRILVCTEAAGMGCDIPDIDIVVQWKLPSTFSNFIQRAGRVARGRGRTGLAVLIVERSAYSIDLTPSNAPPAGHGQANTVAGQDGLGRGKVKPAVRGRKKKNMSSAPQAKAPKQYAEAHSVNHGGNTCKDDVPAGEQPRLDTEALDEGLLVFVQSVRCRRRIWADAFESPLSAPTGSSSCCDICDPALLDRTRPGAVLPAKKIKRVARGHPDVEAQLKLCDWRDMVYERDHPGSLYDSTAILDDSSIERLVTAGNLPHNILTSILKPSWVWWDKYGDELITYIAALNIKFIPKPGKKTTKQTNAPASIAASSNLSSHPARLEPSGTAASK